LNETRRQALSDHVTPEDVQGLLAGSLDRKRVRGMVAHLLGGCASCRSAMLPQVQSLLSPPEPEVEIPAALGSAYDAAIQRALHGAREAVRQERQPAVDEMRARLSRLGTDGFLAAPRRLRGIASVEALLQKSWELRQDDPQKMLHFALLATIEAGKLDPGPLSETQVDDLRCRASIELGNAYRVADRLQEAEEVLGEAGELFRSGTGDSRLKARLLDVQGSLYGDQRRFDLCFTTLDIVITLYREISENHLAGRALITKAVHTRYANEPEKAIELLQEGLSLIDPQADPTLTLNAVHNLAWLMVDSGRFRDVRKILWDNRSLYEDHGGTVGSLRLRWLEGRVNAGLGKLTEAERDLQAAREGLEAAGLPYTDAIAALDLAELELRRSCPEPAEALALQAVGTFLSLKISREAQTAVLFLEEAARHRLMTGAVLRDVADFLRRVEADPRAQFEPGR
jgi:tetratricopeptide (TPR) repeat protein